MSKTEPVLIAVDGGGTGCRVAVGTPGLGVLAHAKGGPANIKTSFDGAMQNITAAVSEALQQAGLQDAILSEAIAHVGLAGADNASGRERTSAALPYGHCTVTGDRETSVAGVLGPRDGFVIALGTGTIIARQLDGQIRTVNGWGFAVSDHGSGAWLGHQLIEQVLLAEEGMTPPSALSRQISSRLGGLDRVVDFSLSAGPGTYAKFAPEIFDAARNEDPLALELLRKGAGFLERGLRALGFGRGDMLCLAGGVGPHYLPYLSSPFTDDVQPPKGNALEGAFTLARAAALPG